MSKPAPESSGYRGVEGSEHDVDDRYVLQHKSRLPLISGATTIISPSDGVLVVSFVI